MAPVRANVRGTWDVHSSSTLTVSPGPDRFGSGTRITVRSSGFPSSGDDEPAVAEVNRRRAVEADQPDRR